MAIAELWSSAMGDAMAYTRERLLNARVGLLVVLVTGLSLIAAPTQDAVELVGRAALIALLVSHLRLWDDLEDLPYDRIHHPNRVLPNQARLKPIWLTLGVAIVLSACLVALVGGIAWLTLYAGLITFLLLIYRGPRRLMANRSLRVQLILLKYPVLLILGVPTPGSLRTLVASFLAYTLLSAHEWLDDHTLRRMRQP
jgi:4-hydroxybenzoate polyprenyltransferase